MGKIINGVYYNSQGEPSHSGVVKVDDKLYYAGKNGVIVKDSKKTIHHGMANGLLNHGVYYFDAEGVCDTNSFERSKRRRRKKGSHRKKMNKPLKYGLIAALSVILLSTLTVLLITEISENNSASKDNTSDTQPQEHMIVLPEYKDDVYLCSDALKQFYQGDITLQEARELSKKAYQPFVFNYKIINAESASLLLSENEDLSDGMTYTLDVDKDNITVDNLKTGMTYYYLVAATNADGKKETETGSFKTADGNRFISFTGVYNTRDIGGYDTVYGKKIKQGVLVRGTELDGMVESHYFLKDVTETEPFHFVCDFDLRSNNLFNTPYYVSRLGENVKHQFYSSPMYGAVFEKDNAEILNQIFTGLADPANYPMYLHCTYGADRTGTIVFLLQGLLGVSEEDMMTEYELTGFFMHDYIYGESFSSMCWGLREMSGNTINEKIESFMKENVGITEEQIRSIRKIFLD